LLTSLQVLHNELEDSLRNHTERLDNVTQELDKQRELNEKLENDLLSIDNQKDAYAPAEPEDDALAGLDIGKRAVIHFISLLETKS